VTVARPEESVQRARDRYLVENGLGTELYSERWVRLPVGPWRPKLYNPKQRRWAIARHDLHHVATGYGTDPAGEMEISGWEVGAGLGRLWVAWAICWPFFLIGLLRNCERTLAAYRLGKRGRSLFARPDAYEEWLRWSVGELRLELGLPEGGALADADRDSTPRTGSA
jgi:hypothetical protein